MLIDVKRNDPPPCSDYVNINLWSSGLYTNISTIKINVIRTIAWMRIEEMRTNGRVWIYEWVINKERIRTEVTKKMWMKA